MLDIIQVLSVRNSYDLYRNSVADHTISEETKQILDDMGIYFKTFKSIEVIEWDAFETWFCVILHSSYKDSRLEVYRKIFSKLRDFEVTEVTEEVVRTFIERDFAARAADTAMKIADGTDSNKIEVLADLVEDYRKAAQVTVCDVADEDFDMEALLLRASSSGDGLEWRHPELNKSLGPLRKGNLVAVAAPVETGKTTFLASEVTHMASQLKDDEVVLWFNNEESNDAVNKRIFHATINRSESEVRADVEAALETFDKLNPNGRIVRVITPELLTVAYIRSKLKEYDGRVKLIVVDQLWKVVDNFHKDTTDVHKITLLFNHARNWARQYGPVLVAHQAVASDGERYIPMSNLYMSRTGLQGECDAIITINKTDEAGMYSTRFINIPKNKLVGGEDSDPEYRHAKFEARIDHERARYS